jgi:hypothetical protein
VRYSVIPSGARNLSFFVFLQLNRREITRSARNDRNGEFFRKLFSLRQLGLAITKLRRLKPAPLVAPQLFCEDQNLSNACKAAQRVETGKKKTHKIANKLIGLRS